MPLLLNTNSLKTGLINIAKNQLQNLVWFWEEFVFFMHIIWTKKYIGQSVSLRLQAVPTLSLWEQPSIWPGQRCFTCRLLSDF